MAVASTLPIPSHGKTPERPRMTPDEMLGLPDDGRLYELIDGQRVEKCMSDLAQFVANRVKQLLDQWCGSDRGGSVLVEASYRCFPFDSDLIRRPDVSFLSRERLAGYAWGHGHFTLAPDLAVEVVSPRDEVYELDRKIGEYLRAGVKRVWVVNPDQRIVRIHRAPGDLSELAGDAVLVDEPLLPGFRCPLATLFAPPVAAATA